MRYAEHNWDTWAKFAKSFLSFAMSLTYLSCNLRFSLFGNPKELFVSYQIHTHLWVRLWVCVCASLCMWVCLVRMTLKMKMILSIVLTSIKITAKKKKWIMGFFFKSILYYNCINQFFVKSLYYFIFEKSIWHFKDMKFACPLSLFQNLIWWW